MSQKKETLGSSSSAAGVGESANKSSQSTSTKHHSVAVQEKLKYIQSESNRISKERKELETLQKKFLGAELVVMNEIQSLRQIQKYCKSSVLNTMTPEQWTEFFEKYFVRGETDEANQLLEYAAMSNKSEKKEVLIAEMLDEKPGLELEID